MQTKREYFMHFNMTEGNQKRTAHFPRIQSNLFPFQNLIFLSSDNLSPNFFFTKTLCGLP